MTNEQLSNISIDKPDFSNCTYNSPMKKEYNQKLDDAMAVMLGHAIGDAMGVPVEFMSRRELAENPVKRYRGYGTHNVPAGIWSDDTSMALATLDSLAHGLDYTDMMRRFCDWKTNAEYTATNEVFDMGITTNNSLCKFLHGVSPLNCGGNDEHDNGNGSLMRIIPAVLYCSYMYSDTTMDERMQIIHNVSALTHAHLRSKIGCGIYAIVMSHLLASKSKTAIRDGLLKAKSYYEKQLEFTDELEHYSRLFTAEFAELPESEINSSGYVVATLEAAVWCVLNTESYADCVLKAVNLGKDTDTVAAVAGGLAAALYGLQGIPQEWIDGFLRKEMIVELCENFVNYQNSLHNNACDGERILLIPIEKSSNVPKREITEPPVEREPIHYLVDAHGHYLFGIDDGSVSIDMSVKMIQEAYEQGVRCIICTSHSWGYFEKYKHNFAELSMHLQKENIDVKLYPGSEIACTERSLSVIIDRLENGHLLPMGNSKYILLEFETDVSGAEILRCAKQIMERTSYKPIIAHIERYHNLYEDKQTIITLKSWSVPFQINAYSLVEERSDRIRNFARKMLGEKLVSFVGSDAHRTTHRPPIIKNGVEYIYKNCDVDYADDICYRNAEHIFFL